MKNHLKRFQSLNYLLSIWVRFLVFSALLCTSSHLFSCDAPILRSFAESKNDDAQSHVKKDKNSKSSSTKDDIIPHHEWAFVLSQIVSPSGEVNYPALQKPSLKRVFVSYLKRLETSLPKHSEHYAALSYWLNAYNALTVRHVLRYPGLKSVATAVEGADRYAFFKERIHLVAGRLRSLDEIEHQIIRQLFKDPRVHVALNCASSSCPKLPQFAFHAKTVDKQLDDLARDFVNDSSRNEISNGKLHLSKIFKWYSEDFESSSLVPNQELALNHRGVRGFIKRYARFHISSSASISFKVYDWSLNGPAPTHIWLSE